jgi:extradiol dioxygenase family protein
MSFHTAPALFHFSFAVDDLDRARKFYGEVLGCPEGRKLPGRADFNFFGHHLVAHLAPEQTVGTAGRKLGAAGKTPIRHFGAILTLDDFKRTVERLQTHTIDFLNPPEVTQKGSVREQMLMTVLDGCGNAIEFKGLAQPTDVYKVVAKEGAATV